jgi:GTP-binding protein
MEVLSLQGCNGSVQVLGIGHLAAAIRVELARRGLDQGGVAPCREALTIACSDFTNPASFKELHRRASEQHMPLLFVWLEEASPSPLRLARARAMHTVDSIAGMLAETRESGKSATLRPLFWPAVPMHRPIRNIAIIAHVDHGKTTLVDCLLKQSGTFAAHEKMGERIMDSNDIERERGITILAKNCAIEYGGTRINIVDTPGHADFGGEVERVLSMVDGVLLLVDAVEGPMPQTRFVTRKALALGLKAIVVVNKIDRPGARPGWVVDHTFELFDKLGATDAQLDFPVIYASALQGWAGLDYTERLPDMTALFEAILKYVPPPPADADAPLQLQISTLDYNSYVGRIGIGRIRHGSVSTGQTVALRNGKEDLGTAKITQVLTFKGLQRRPVEEAFAGDIVAITGIEAVSIGLTVCDPENAVGLPPISVDEPTLQMNFQVNTSPLAGREGKFVTSRQIRERLQQELQSNVALRVEDTDEPDILRVSGRGELHLTILIENMRREGYELAVSRPQVLTRMVNGVVQEPYEALTIDIDESAQGGIMEALGTRRAELTDMLNDGNGRVRLEYRVPARGLIGFQGEFMTLTRGNGLMSHIFDGYAPVKGDIPDRHNGVLISNENGPAVAYALFNLQERGRMFVSPGEALYEGMIIGVHSRENDLVVNPIKTKKLTNVRAAGKDDAILLTPPITLTLEYAVEFIADDELVEVTPASIRIRKRKLKETDRKRASRSDAA